jgi:hypothetical protein
MSTWLQLKQRIKNNQLNLEDAQRLAIPFVLCEALEADVYVLRLIDDSWTAVEEVKDIDIPSSISNIKDGEISRLLDRLSAFKVCNQV